MKTREAMTGLGFAAALAGVAFTAGARDWPPVPEAEVTKIEGALPAKPTVAPARARKILVFYRCEGFPHSSIPYCNKMLEIMARKTGAFSVDLTEDYKVFDAANLAKYDAILLNNTTTLKLDEAQRKAILDFVRGGKGFIGIHAATDNFYDWPEGAEMIGGMFDGHPWGAGGTWAFKLDDPTHPINRGFGGKGFVLSDEIYQIKGAYSREKFRVLISLDMSDERNKKIDPKGVHRTDNDFGVAWIRPYEKGRVFYSSLGHNHDLFWNTAVVQHYLDGIQYALGDLKCDDSPSRK